jgi:UrcA family protein
MKTIIKTNGTILGICAVAAMLSAFVATGAFAGESNDQVRSETVKFGDLNLGAPAGVAALYQRVHTAAMHVCGDEQTGDLASWKQYKSCIKQAEDRAVKDINVEGLTAYYQMKTGQQPTATRLANMSK